jgi:YD repeat-containing protein
MGCCSTVTYGYDNLARVTSKNLPGTEPDVTIAYDLLNRATSASQTGNALSFTWDALGRNLTQVGPQGTATSVWDTAGRRTKLTYPGSGLYVNTDYMVTGEVDKIRENNASSGVGVLADYAFDDLGRRTSVTYGNGAVQSYTFDPVSRLAAQELDGELIEQLEGSLFPRELIERCRVPPIPPPCGRSSV